MGLAALALTAVVMPTAPVLAGVLMIFGYGQGLVMAPLSGVVLSTVRPAAGSGSGPYGTVTQIGNAAGVAAIGAVFFALEAFSPSHALFAALLLLALAIMPCVAFLTGMGRATA
jgi:predicted MFS family arabinose efflux permease